MVVDSVDVVGDSTRTGNGVVVILDVVAEAVVVVLDVVVEAVVVVVGDASFEVGGF